MIFDEYDGGFRPKSIENLAPFLDIPPINDPEDAVVFNENDLSTNGTLSFKLNTTADGDTFFLKDSSSNSLFQITNNLDSRFQAIKRDYNVGELKLLDSTWFSKRSDAELFEKEIHILYQVLISSKRGGQEWFSLSNMQVKYLQQLFRRKEKEEVFNARTTITKVWGMTSQEYEKERQRVFWIYFLRPFILLFPILLIIYGGLGPRIETIMLWIFSLIFCSFIGTIFSGKIKQYRFFYRTYGEDGNALTADFPIKQYRRLNLWKEEKIFINDKKITSVEHIPEKISPYFPNKKL